ncbi:MAG: DUF4335 domain-containing protein [Cyanobacteria bacterium P01_C01_bin.121]
MTMQRQYQLPNCSIILDGLSIDPSPGNENVMSLLVNAECRISGLERSLNGGYNFFAALVRAVSQYGQEVLSGYAHPQVVEGEPLLVHINPGEGPYHHLVVQPEVADLGESGDGRAIDIKLSAVQLFDLTEAVDQFFDDKQTLPELEPALAPLPKRFVRSDEPLSDRAVPAVLGVGSLVAATMAFGLLPVPELRDPNVEVSQGAESGEVVPVNDNTSGSEPPTGASEPEDNEIAAVPLDEETLDEANGDADAATGEDSDVEVVTTSLDATEDAAATEENNPEQASDVEDADAETDLTTAETTDGETTAESTSTENSDSEFSSFDDFKEEEEDSTTVANSTTANSSTFENEPPARVTSFAQVRTLNSQLKQTIVENRDQPRFGEAVSYRVRVSESGTITGYQSIDSSAESAIGETPLPGLVKGDSGEDSSIDYRVVFTERGVVEVSPWWGWSYYE